jgi:hypothetical protein
VYLRAPILEPARQQASHAHPYLVHQRAKPATIARTLRLLVGVQKNGTWLKRAAASFQRRPREQRIADDLGLRARRLRECGHASLNGNIALL